jgi:hypothetical protein
MGARSGRNNENKAMRTKLDNNNPHNAETHMKEKVEENYITLPL